MDSIEPTRPHPHTVAAAIDAIGTRLDRFPFALMLDVDGTLAPIAPTPAAASLTPEMRDVIRQLAATAGVTLALVSGRAADDADRLVAVAGVWVIGNHGYELRSPDGETTARDEVLAYEDAMANAARALVDLDRFPGAVLEHKRWTLSAHYRNVDAASAEALVARARSVAEELGLRATEGKMVLELRPPLAIDKGTAVRDFALRVGAIPAGSVLYAGDDRTDEDAFRSLRDVEGAVTVRISDDPAQETSAQIVLGSPAEVQELLTWIAARRRALG